MKQITAIRKELAIAGVPKRVMNSREVQALTNILSPDEQIIACVQGLYSEGIGIVVGTSSRLLIVNKSFFWTKLEDESYAMINSVLYKRGVFFGKLFLSPRARHYVFNVLTKDPIEQFISFIDSQMRRHSRPVL